MREPVWLQTKNADKKTTLYVPELSEGAASSRRQKGAVRQLLVHDNATEKKSPRHWTGSGTPAPSKFLTKARTLLLRRSRDQHAFVQKAFAYNMRI